MKTTTTKDGFHPMRVQDPGHGWLAADVQSLHLIESGSRGMTESANAAVSAAAARLLSLGLIDYAPSRWVGYKLTATGRALLADSYAESMGY